MEGTAPPLKSLNQRWLLQYLAQGGCAYKNVVTAVHIWNLPSWDVQASTHSPPLRQP